MRALFLTNFYPPASRGGYEQWCQEVAERLRPRHQVVVLTSRFGRDALPASDPDWVRRDLHLEMDLNTMRNGIRFFTSRTARERDNVACIVRQVRDFAPDVVLVWGMWNLDRGLAAAVESLAPGRVAYYIGDYWASLPSQHVHYWDAPARTWLSAVPKRALAAVARRMLARRKSADLHFEHALFPTRFMQTEYERLGIVPRRSRVVYGGADTSVDVGEPEAPSRSGTHALLYVGRLTHDKGVHTAIEALGLLVRQDQFQHLRLAIVGTGEAEASLRRLVLEQRLEDQVTFFGHQPAGAVRAFYRQADVLVFPSIWQEPFGRVLVEAMAAGLVVVGTATGGAAEILTNDETALTFPPCDAEALARAVKRLVESEPLRARLADAASRRARARFGIDRMSAEIEAYLMEMTAGATAEIGGIDPINDWTEGDIPD
ncbi:MAG TPA: glycosyltransferase family 4 protein [Vicinamibacterales bacterium]|nr:glycosyltransferase family 4 protein [Vicinamibacterales bacterium]